MPLTLLFTNIFGYANCCKKAKIVRRNEAVNANERNFSTPAEARITTRKKAKKTKKMMLDKKHMLRYSLAEKSTSACFRLIFKKGKKSCRDSPTPRKE
ncbi:hypothetical protein KY361_01700 [Candidatus Woesearchaeota archaeon]|nr:hypothetical protein [Candidatus Woesearchaeota archaeon]